MRNTTNKDYFSIFETLDLTKWIDLSILTHHLPNPIYKSQNGEDYIIEEIMNRCNPEHKIIVEVGGHDPVEISNSWHMITQCGWDGVLIEKDDIWAKKEFEYYKDNPKVHCIHSEVTPNNLNSLLSPLCLPKNFACLSIDIDCWDYEVWKNLTYYEPELVIIEQDPFENDLSVESYFPDRTEFDDPYLGGVSLGLLLKLAKEKGYEYIYTHNQNSFFIKPEFAKGIRI